MAATGDAEVGVPRRVVVEMFTATWCTNCPAADQAAESLAEELGDSLTLIEYHPTFGSPLDPFGTAQTEQRFAHYGVSAPPVFVCDGVARVAGAVPNLLSEYRSAAIARLRKSSPVSITLNGGLGAASVSYSVTVSSEIEDRIGGLRLLLVLVEDSISYAAPNGVSLHRLVARRLDPDNPGEVFSLEPGSQHTRNGSIALEPSWVQERLGLTAIVQDETTGELLQSAWVKLFQAEYAIQLAAADTLLDGQANSLVSFPFTIRNIGNMADTMIIDLPQSLAVPETLLATICDRQFCYPLPLKWYIPASDSLTSLEVHITPYGSGRSTAVLTVKPQSSPSDSAAARFHVEVP